MDVDRAANPLEEAGRPFAVSLVVPVRNEASSIGALLESIQGQTLPPDEIVFVDGGSKDDTVRQLRRAAREDERIRLIEAGDATPGRGRNVGITAAKNEWIALTDAGTRPERTWLERLVDEVRRDTSLQVVFGHYEPVIVSFFERCAALAYVSPAQRRPGGMMRGPSIASALLRRSVWRAAGGFPDLRAAEDLIFMEAVNNHGFPTGWAPGAVIWWHLQPSLGRTIRKFVSYSRHNVRAGRQRHWHYGLARLYLACVPFIALGLVHSLFWLAVPALGALARVAKNIWDRRESRGLLWALNPFQFAGVGVVMACIDFATFWGWVEALRRPRSGGSFPPAGERDLMARGKG